MFNDIANFVENVLQKAVIQGKGDAATKPTANGLNKKAFFTKLNQELATSEFDEDQEEQDLNNLDNLNEKESDERNISAEDQVFAVRRYFEQLSENDRVSRNLTNDATMKDAGNVKKSSESDANRHSVMYKTWKPIGDVSNNNYIEESEHVHHGPILHSGILWKQGRRPNIWKQRFFVLRESGLAYYTHSDPMTITAIKMSIENDVQNEKLDKERLIQKRVSHVYDLMNMGEDAEQARLSAQNHASRIFNNQSNVFDQLKRGPPKARGNIYFVDVVTPNGRVVDDLDKMQKSYLGGKDNAFLIQTEDTMCVLATQTPDEKLDWIQEVDKSYAKYVKQMIRKVAIMELSWTFTDELLTKEKTQNQTSNVDEDVSLSVSNSKTVRDTQKPKKAKGFLQTLMKRGNSKDKEKTDPLESAQEKPKPRETLSSKGKDSDKPVQAGALFGKLMKQTLERTSTRFYGNDAAKRQKEMEKEEADRIKKQIKNMRVNARGSLSRMEKKDKMRLSAKRVGVVLAEAMSGLTDKFEEQLAEKNKRLMLEKCFVAWKTYSKYNKDRKNNKLDE